MTMTSATAMQGSQNPYALILDVIPPYNKDLSALLSLFADL